MAPQELPLKVAVAGHIDHGKSTLVGRLLHDTGALPDGKVQEVEAMCRRRGMPFEWAFVTDALQVERDQGITVEVSHIRFRSARRRYVLIDAPGHRELVKNMVTGAASCDAAVLVVDAAEGVREQSRRHGLLLHLLGVRQVAVAVNKMDLGGFSAGRFAEVERDVTRYLASIGVTPQAVVPVAARGGDNLARRSGAMAWYAGPTLLEALDRFEPPPPATDRPLRLPVQDVYKFDHRRIIAGRIESGRLAVGDEVLFSPSNRAARVKSIEAWSDRPGFIPPQSAEAGQAVGITLTDEIFVERGEILSHAHNPPLETSVFRARLFWLHAAPLEAGARLTLRLGTAEAPVEVQAIQRVVSSDDLAPRDAARIEYLDVAEVVLRARRMLVLDPHADNPATGRFALLNGIEITGGGIISMEGYPDQRPLITPRAANVSTVEHRVSLAARAARNGHRGGVVWLTGLPSSGKSTLAMTVEHQLFAQGYQGFVLDGDNLRYGLNANLGFSPADRAENIRRAGEVAALFAQAGFIVIAAFISPYRADRDRARAAARHPETAGFHEVYIRADVATCEGRDPKGLYARARAGLIPEFTGISAPYEAPDTPDLIIDTCAATVEECAARLLEYIRQQFPPAGS